MSETRRKYDPEFRAGAVGIVRETKRSIAEVARELGINDGTLGNWVKRERIVRGEDGGLSVDDHVELVRLGKRCAELEMERELWPAGRDGHLLSFSRSCHAASISASTSSSIPGYPTTRRSSAEQVTRRW